MFRFRPVIYAAALLGTAFGLVLLFFPRVLFAVNGVHTDLAGEWLARLAGAVLLEVGITHFLLVRTLKDTGRAEVLFGLVVGAAAGLFVTGGMVVLGITGTIGAVNALIYLYLLIGSATALMTRR